MSKEDKPRKDYLIDGEKVYRHEWALVEIAMDLHAMITGSADFEPVAAKRMALFIKARLKDWWDSSFPYHANLTMAINTTEDHIFMTCASVLREYAAFKKWRKK